MGIGRDVSVGVLNQKQIAEAPDFISSVSDDAVLYGINWRATTGADVDPVIAQAAFLGAKTRDYSPFDWPNEPASGSCRRRRHRHRWLGRR